MKFKSFKSLKSSINTNEKFDPAAHSAAIRKTAATPKFKAASRTHRSNSIFAGLRSDEKAKSATHDLRMKGIMPVSDGDWRKNPKNLEHSRKMQDRFKPHRDDPHPVHPD